jgi:hypothetical protein
MLLDRSFALSGFWICEKFTQILNAWMHKGPSSTLCLILNDGILQQATSSSDIIGMSSSDNYRSVGIEPTFWYHKTGTRVV